MTEINNINIGDNDLQYYMAQFVCTKGEKDIEFCITTESGAVHGTSIPYIENCPFCGADKKYIEVINRKATHFNSWDK